MIALQAKHANECATPRDNRNDYGGLKARSLFMIGFRAEENMVGN